MGTYMETFINFLCTGKNLIYFICAVGVIWIFFTIKSIVTAIKGLFTHKFKLFVRSIYESIMSMLLATTLGGFMETVVLIKTGENTYSNMFEAKTLLMAMTVIFLMLFLPMLRKLIWKIRFEL
jgi:hypothetical protein